MTGEQTKADRFTEALGAGVDSAFKKLASKIFKKGALTVKDKALIALACSVAVRCESCIHVNRGGVPWQPAQAEKRSWKPQRWPGLCAWDRDSTRHPFFLRIGRCGRCQVP